MSASLKGGANRFSPFAIRKSQATVDTGRRYAFGKVEQVSERGTSVGNLRLVTLRL